MVYTMLRNLSHWFEQAINYLLPEPDKNNSKRLLVKTYLSIAILVLVFGYLTYKSVIGINNLIATGVDFNPRYLVLSILCQLIGTGIMTWVWGNILSKLGIRSYFIFDFEAYTTSALARKIPGGVWYALSRVFIYNLIQASKLIVIIGLIIESLISMLAGAVNLSISFLGGIYFYAWIKQPWVIFGVVVFVLVASVLLGPVVIQKVILKSLISLGKLDWLKKPGSLDILLWILGIQIVLFFATGVGFFLKQAIKEDLQVPFLALLGAFNLGVVLSPISMWLPGNAGLRDGITYLVLRPFVGDEYAALLALSWRIWVYILEVALGLVCGFSLSRRYRLFRTGKNEL